MRRKELAGQAFRLAALWLWLEAFNALGPALASFMLNLPLLKTWQAFPGVSPGAPIDYGALLTAMLLTLGGRYLYRNSGQLAAHRLGGLPENDTRAARLTDAVAIAAALLGVYFCATGVEVLLNGVGDLIQILFSAQSTRPGTLPSGYRDAMFFWEALPRMLMGLCLYRGSRRLALIWRPALEPKG